MSSVRWLKKSCLRYQGKNNIAFKDQNIILGIDPGTIHCGYGLIKTVCKEKTTAAKQGYKYLASGRISMSPQKDLKFRLKNLYDEVIKIIKEFKPDVMVVENIFFAKSVRAALCLGQARGVIILAAVSEKLPIYEYSALEVKKAVTGYGNAEKLQVQNMVLRILSLENKKISLTEDSADALALAICHSNTINFLNNTG